MPKLLSTGSWVVVLALSVGAQARVAPRSQAATQALVQAFRDADTFALKAIVLLALGERWHPAGTEPVLQALRDRDVRLRAFALETLVRTGEEGPAMVASRDLVGELIQKQLTAKEPYYQERVREVLGRIFPDGKARSRTEWSTWWFSAAKTYEPVPWSEPAAEEAGVRGKGGTVAQTLVERAFDLNAAGLEVAICIDSTGSMQVAIDQARDAVEDLVSLLRGIAPKFRLGLVHYRDVTDFSAGAEIRVQLTQNVAAVHASLADLRAGGGGDTPEAVEKGLEQALLPAMGWQKTTNKLVVIVGDAPPHPENIPIAVELARTAHERPFQRKNAPTTGKEKSNVRPFVISALALNNGSLAAFREITDAGGGMCVSLAPQGARRGPAEERASAASRGTKAFVKQVLVLSFGSQWRESMDEFVEIYFAYRDAGVFR